jgi:hypothetical protein
MSAERMVAFFGEKAWRMESAFALFSITGAFFITVSTGTGFCGVTSCEKEICVSNKQQRMV